MNAARSVLSIVHAVLAGCLWGAPLASAQQYVGQFLATFKEFPPSQKVGSFSLDQVLESLQRGGAR